MDISAQLTSIGPLLIVVGPQFVWGDSSSRHSAATLGAVNPRILLHRIAPSPFVSASDSVPSRLSRFRIALSHFRNADAPFGRESDRIGTPTRSLILRAGLAQYDG